MLELKPNRMKVQFELLDDRDSSNGSESVPEDGCKNVDLGELVIGGLFVFADDLGKDVVGRAVERAEISNDKSIRNRAVRLADPRKLDSVDAELGKGNVVSVKHVPDKFGCASFELNSCRFRRHLRYSVVILRSSDRLHDEIKLVRDFEELGSKDKELDSSLLIQLVEVNLVEYRNVCEPAQALLETDDDVRHAGEI